MEESGPCAGECTRHAFPNLAINLWMRITVCSSSLRSSTATEWNSVPAGVTRHGEADGIHVVLNMLQRSLPGGTDRYKKPSERFCPIVAILWLVFCGHVTEETSPLLLKVPSLKGIAALARRFTLPPKVLLQIAILKVTTVTLSGRVWKTATET